MGLNLFQFHFYKKMQTYRNYEIFHLLQKNLISYCKCFIQDLGNFLGRFFQQMLKI